MALKTRTLIKIFLLFLLPQLLIFLTAFWLFYYEPDFKISILGLCGAFLLSLVLNLLIIKKVSSPLKSLMKKAEALLGEKPLQKFSDEFKELIFRLEKIKLQTAEYRAEIKALKQSSSALTELKLEEFQAIYLLNEDLTVIPEMLSAPHKIIDLIKKLFSPDFVAFYSYHEPDGFILTASQGLSEKQKEMTRVVVAPRSKDPLYPLVNARLTVKIVDPFADPALKERLFREKTGIYFALPVMGKDKLKGLIETGWEEELNEKDEKLLNFLAKQTGMILDNIAIHQGALKEKEALKAMLLGCQVGIIKLNQDYKVQFFNRAAGEITGFSEKEALGKFCHQVFPGKTREGQPVCSEQNCYLKGKTNLYEYQLYFDNLGQKERILKFLPQFTPDGIILSFYDISGLIKLEKLYGEFFARTFEEILSKLANLREKLSFALKPKTLPDKADLLSGLEEAKRSLADQTLNLEELFQVARLKGESLYAFPQPVYLEKIAEKTAAVFKQISPENEIKIYSEVSTRVLGDAARFEYVMAGLLRNAISFSPPGLGIQVLIKENPEEIIFRVEDSGPGAEDPFRKKLLDQVNKLKGFEKKLNTARELSFYFIILVIEAHGGKVFAESCPETGMRFGFSLPKAKT